MTWTVEAEGGKNSLADDNSASDDGPSNYPGAVCALSREQVLDIVASVEQAISHNSHPIPISRGSSGSYFCRDSSGRIVGVFKPRDEEPYSKLNPKLTKWIQRKLFPCGFGRSCLIPNSGYLAEAASSYLDSRLSLAIVPCSQIISLTSPVFSYSPLDRISARKRSRPSTPESQRSLTFSYFPRTRTASHRGWEALPPKTGSFQAFLPGYQEASSFFAQGNMMNELVSCVHNVDLGSEPPSVRRERTGSDSSSSTLFHGRSHPRVQSNMKASWSESKRAHFQDQFERLVVLDFLTRQTDRGMDNWMVCEAGEDFIYIGAIDNGLSFPWKHPDRFRSYPYAWASLPIALKPFSQAIRTRVGAMLRDPKWWRETEAGLECLFRQDPSFDVKLFQGQMSVVRGQAIVLLQVFEDQGGCPVDLTQIPSCYATSLSPASSLGEVPDDVRLIWEVEPVQRHACFKSC